MLGGINLSYSEFTQIFIIVLFIYFMIKNNEGIDKKLILSSLLLLIIILFGLMQLVYGDFSNVQIMPIGKSWDQYVLFGIDSRVSPSFSKMNIERLIRIIIFIVTIICLSVYIIKYDLKFRKSFIVAGWILLIVGIIDILTKYIIGENIISRFSSFFFGYVPSQSFAVGEIGLFKVQGFFKETSHYTRACLPIIIVLLFSPIKTKYDQILEWGLIVILSVSGSFTGISIVIYWFIVRIIRILYKFKCKINKRYVLIFIAGLIILITIIIFFGSEIIKSEAINYYIKRINNLFGVTENKFTSENVRLISITSAMDIFFKYPIFGIGIGSTDSHGFIPTILVNIGIIGSISYVIYIFLFIKKINIKDKILYKSLSLFPLLWFIGNIEMIYDTMIITMILSLLQDR